MTNNQIDLFFQNYKNSLSCPCINWKKSKFIQSSYSRWAVEELIIFIKQHSDMLVIDSVELFIRKMDEYSCMNSNSSYIFSIAHDVAEDVYDNLLSNLYI